MGERVARAVYRLLILAYPREFRASYDRSMIEDFLRLRRAATGPAERGKLWLRAALDVFVTSAQVRWGTTGFPVPWTVRNAGRGDFFRDLRQDVLYAFRLLRRSPGYSLVVVLTLGLGIGANTAMFSLVNGVLLAPLPYAQGDRIVHLRQLQPGVGDEDMPFSVHEIEDYRSLNSTFTDVVEYHAMTFTLLGIGEPTLVQTGVVSARFFDVLGMKPVLGRGFTTADDRLGAQPVMLLSYEFWRDRFGSDPEVIGNGFTMNDRVHTVIGVLPPMPQYPDRNDVYMPTSQCPTRSAASFIADRQARLMTVFGVLRPDASLEDARTDLGSVAATLSARYPDVYTAIKGYDAEISSLKEDLVARARPTLLVLMATTLLVLVIACANVASLALARAVRRGRELAVRQAIGAGRRRLVRQLLTESTVLAVLGGLLGVVVARSALDLLVGFAGRMTPRAFEATLDGRVLAFALGVSVLTGLTFGSLPALRWADAAKSSVGRDGIGSMYPGLRRAHAWLVAAQVSLAFVLLIGAGLLTRTFMALSSAELGYQSQPVLSAEVILPTEYYGESNWKADEFFDELLERVNRLEGVRVASRTQSVPLGANANRTGMETGENPDVTPDEYAQVVPVRVSPTYLATLGIPVLSGRGLTEADIAGEEPVTVLSAGLAQALWPGKDPLNRKVRLCSYHSGNCGAWATVVGVAGDVKMEGLESDVTPAAYVAASNRSWNGNTVVIRTDGDLDALARQLTELVHELEPDAPVAGAQPLQTLVADAVAPRRLTAALMGILAVLALTVTLAGVAGVVAFTASERTHEIGVRMALGARPESVRAHIVRTGMIPAAIGLVVGGVVAVAVSRTLTHLVWGVEPTDTLTFLCAALMLGAGAFLACWLPARRATNVDPALVLRME